jgi:hypothetical protein
MFTGPQGMVSWRACWQAVLSVLLSEFDAKCAYISSMTLIVKTKILGRLYNRGDHYKVKIINITM